MLAKEDLHGSKASYAVNPFMPPASKRPTSRYDASPEALTAEGHIRGLPRRKCMRSGLFDTR